MNLSINIKSIIALTSALLICSIFFAPLTSNYAIFKDMKYIFFIINIVCIFIFFMKYSFIIQMDKRTKWSFIYLNIFFVLFILVSIFHYNGNPSYIVNYVLLISIFLSLNIIKNDDIYIKYFSQVVLFLSIIYLSLATFNLINFVVTKNLVFNFYSFEYYRLNSIFRLGMGLEDPNFISLKIMVLFLISYFILNNKVYNYLFLFFMFLSLSVGFLGLLLLFYAIINFKNIFKFKYIFIFLLLLGTLVYFIISNEIILDILTRKFIDAGSSTGKSSLLVSIDARLEQYIIGIKILFENIFGIGAENFVSVATAYCVDNRLYNELNDQGTFHDFHNTIFQILITAGIFSFLFFLLFTLVVFRNIKTFELRLYFLFFILASATINSSNVLQFWLLLLFFNFMPYKFQINKMS